MAKIEVGKINIEIKNRTLPQVLTLFIFIMPFFLAFFLELLGTTSFIKYTIDVAWVFVGAFIFINSLVKNTCIQKL